MRRRTFALSDEEQSSPLMFYSMENRMLSVFVDESGKFQFPDSVSRFYIVGLVLHDQSASIDELVRKLDSDWNLMGYEDLCFHAGPLIRKEKGYAYLPRERRAAIFARMMVFARQLDYRFHCLVVDKRYVTSSRQIVEKLQHQLGDFIEERLRPLESSERIKVYYDCGQAPVTRLLHDTFTARLNDRVTFVQSVRPQKYKLFQLADLICTLKLIECKLACDMRMTEDEFRFFGGPRRFLRNVLKQIKTKEI